MKIDKREMSCLLTQRSLDRTQVKALINGTKLLTFETVHASLLLIVSGGPLSIISEGPPIDNLKGGPPFDRLRGPRFDHLRGPPYRSSQGAPFNHLRGPSF